MRHFTKDAYETALRAQLGTIKEQAIKGLLRIYEYQTEDEQQCGAVTHYNGVGFTGMDAEFLTSLAQQYQQKGYLSDKQLSYLFKKMPKYSGQLAEQAYSRGIVVKDPNATGRAKYCFASELNK